MPSEYSPLLRLELIGAGEQSGLWGDTTNKNVGTLIEEAIAGVAVIPLLTSGVYIVEALDGTRDEARSAVLNFTGAPGGAVTAQIPSTTKLYVVRNDTNVTLTVKTIAQVSNPLLGGVPLLPSEATLVFCDGTKAVKGIQAEGVGVLGVAGGGTGEDNFPIAGFLKTPGGQGGFTSVANINLDSTDTSGILPAAKGGTGISSSGTAGNGLISTGAGWISGSTVNTITGGTGIQVTGTAGNFTIATTGSGGGVTNVTAASPLSSTGGTTPQISIASNPVFSSSVTAPVHYVGSFAGSTFFQYDTQGASGIGFTIDGVPSTKITASGTATPAVLCQNSAVSAGDQKVIVTGLGYSTGIAPASVQCGAPAYGLTYTPPGFGGPRLDILGGILSAYFTGTSGVQGNNSPNWTVLSDQNLKTNLRPINSALDKLNALKPCHFEYKDELGTTRTGFIAQEFETVFPGHVKDMVVSDNFIEFVPEGQETVKALDPNIQPYLVKAIQELSAKVDAQAAKITALEEQVLNLSVK